MPLIYRDAKGAPLTFQEVDANFKDLDDRLTALEESPPDAEGIASISLDGDQMIFQGTRGTIFGSFTLPKVFWKARGTWKKEAVYAPLDVVASGKSLFLCLGGGESPPPDPSWQEMFSFPHVEPVSKPEKSAFVAPPCEKENLPKDPDIGQMMFVINAPDHPEICYFDGKDWRRMRNGEVI